MIKTGSVASRSFVGVMVVGGAGSGLDGAGRDLNGAGIGLNGAGAEVDGAGVELNGAGPILGLEPAPSEQRRRPIRGAGFAPVLEPAPIIVEPAPDTVRPALGIGTEGNRLDVGYPINLSKRNNFFEK